MVGKQKKIIGEIFILDSKKSFGSIVYLIVFHLGVWDKFFKLIFVQRDRQSSSDENF